MRRRILLAEGRPTELGSRALDILEVLIEAKGELVRKDELLRRVWPDTVVDENNLQVQISALRRVLGDDRNLIRTVAGRGYRFTGEVQAVSDGGEPPPAAAPQQAATPATNLPAPVSALVGRDIELEEVHKLADLHRLVTLTGAGGIGKTRLGIEVGRRLSPEFREGAWLVELAALSDPELVPVAMASVLGLELVGTRSGGEQIAAALAPRNLLLVLDNCEHLVGAAAQVAETVLRAAPAVRVLATSREPLGAEGECIYNLPPLAMPPEDAQDVDEVSRHAAVQLFLQRARAVMPQFDLDARTAAPAAAICRRLDGMPLAIEIAAARAAALGVEGLATLLDARFLSLTGGRRTVLPRHQTLRATLDWSYGLLTEAERTVLRRLSVFAGGFTLEAAGKVARDGAISAADIVEVVVGCVGKSLLTADLARGVPRYRLLETTRAYARERLDESGEQAMTLRRHAEYYRDLLERSATAGETTPPTEWVAALSPEVDNVRAALSWAFAPGGDAAIAIALAAASVQLWLEGSQFGECRRWAEHGLARLDISGGRGTRHEILLQEALAISKMYLTGAANDTRTHWMRALDLAESLGDVEHQLRALYGLWLQHLLIADYRGTLPYGRRFRGIAEQAGATGDIPVADRMDGTIRHYLGDLAAARLHIDRVLAWRAPINRRALVVRFGSDQLTASRVLAARLLWLQGLPDQAMRSGLASIEDAEHLNHANSLCLAIADGAALIAAWTGDRGSTDRLIAELADRADRHRLGVWRSYGLAMRGWVLSGRGDATAGLPMLRQAVAEVAHTPLDIRHPLYLGWLGEALGHAGQPEEAIAVTTEAIRRFREREEAWCLPELLRIRGELTLQRDAGADSAVETDLLEAIAMARGQGALSWELRAATSLARLRRTQRRADEARDLLGGTYGRFSEGFETADLVAARTLLTALAV
ncbi:MAG TPA: winged helix-turn-helix domain-containing protein [Stellaceae bacterium]|nr:winged helix-turn-helix domain-containing protein [Stellaceae bacterium]